MTEKQRAILVLVALVPLTLVGVYGAVLGTGVGAAMVTVAIGGLLALSDVRR